MSQLDAVLSGGQLLLILLNTGIAARTLWWIVDVEKRITQLQTQVAFMMGKQNGAAKHGSILGP
jgi:hypothetical protein